MGLVKKRIYISAWKSEYVLAKGEDTYFLLPTERTNFSILSEGKFSRNVDGSLVYLLTCPENHGRSIEEVIEVAEYNGVLCYVYAGEECGRYVLRPAQPGSGMAVDTMCYEIGSYGTRADFVKIVCPCCQQEFYFNDRNVVKGVSNDVVCGRCGCVTKWRKL